MGQTVWLVLLLGQLSGHLLVRQYCDVNRPILNVAWDLTEMRLAVGLVACLRGPIY